MSIQTSQDYTVNAMPPDEDGNEIVKTTIAKIQMMQIHQFMACFCAECHKQARITAAYKCRWCGVWYCHQCAAKHFGAAATPSNC